MTFQHFFYFVYSFQQTLINKKEVYKAREDERSKQWQLLDAQCPEFCQYLHFDIILWLLGSGQTLQYLPSNSSVYSKQWLLLLKYPEILASIFQLNVTWYCHIHFIFILIIKRRGAKKLKEGICHICHPSDPMRAEITGLY